MYNQDLFLYGVLSRTHDGSYGEPGLQGAPVYLLSRGDLSAAISFIPESAECPDGRAYRRVMRQLLGHAAVLPAPPQTILPSQEALLDLLSHQQQRMLEQLRRFTGLVEVRLRATCRDKSGASQSRSSVSPVAHSEEELLAIAAERDYLSARVCTALRCGGFTVKLLPQRSDSELLRLACLLPRASLALFVLTCESLKDRIDPAYELSISSPLAPLDFIDRHLFHRPHPAA
jgi:hypothetical protein